MAIKSEAGIYQILEDRLRKTDRPLTCVDLFEDSAVRKHAENANKVSDYLGHMWRRGLLQRWYAPKESRAKARYAYTWLEEQEEPQAPAKIASIRPGVTGKPNVTITEQDDKIVLDFPLFTITVERK